MPTGQTARAPAVFDDPDNETARRLEMQHLNAIEGNPLTAEEIAMFAMFEREGWSDERQHSHVMGLLRQRLAPDAAE